MYVIFQWWHSYSQSKVHLLVLNSPSFSSFPAFPNSFPTFFSKHLLKKLLPRREDRLSTSPRSELSGCYPTLIAAQKSSTETRSSCPQPPPSLFSQRLFQPSSPSTRLKKHVTKTKRPLITSPGAKLSGLYLR